MFKKMSVLAVLLLSISTILTGGWCKYYGGASNDLGNAVQQTFDGGFIVCGLTDSWGPGNESVYLLKTDDFGEMTWAKIFGGVETDIGYSVQQCTDSGYIIYGYSNSFGVGNNDNYLIKTDANGTLSWYKTIGNTTDDRGQCIQQTSDGGFILVGYSISGGQSDVLLAKTDNQGNVSWLKYIGGANDDYGSSVQQTSDSGYIICGGTASYGAGSSDVFLVKTDQNGNTIWLKTFGGTDSESSFSVKQTNDGGYIIAGKTRSFGAGLEDFYVIKTDSDGTAIWTKTFGGSSHDIAYCIDETPSGDFIISGETYSYGAGLSDVYLINISPFGDLIWSKTFGDAGADCGRAVSCTNDGGYIIAGKTSSFGAGGLDIYLIKTDSNGVAVEETVISDPHQLSYSISQLGNNSISLNFSLSQSSNIQLNVYDISGRYISTPLAGLYGTGIYNASFDMEKQGIYFFSLKINQNFATGKFTVY